VLGRLAGLAKQHDTIVAVLTTKGASAPSLGSLISLRAEALRVHDGGRFGVRAHALKDKQRGPGWAHVEPVRPPAGLRPRPGSR
jgi:recombination protein RecA